MTLLSLEHIVGTNGYYIDDKTLQIYSFKQKKYTDGKLLKPQINNNGYIRYHFFVNGKYKKIYYHHIIVKMFIKSDYDSAKYDIDHMDRNKLNNSIENLVVVSRSDNIKNMSKSRTGKEFNFVDNIGKSLVINEEAQIYYSLDLDRFFMYINQTNKYKELHELISNGFNYIGYCYNNKRYKLSTTYFRKNLNKK